MEAMRIIESLRSRFPSRLMSIDSHTAGEPTRLIIGGTGPIPGTTMKAKREYLKNHQDRIRLLLTREPRGHRGIMAALLTEPTTAGAKFGLIFMDARRYPFLCGHATIGAVSTLIEAEVLATEQSETTIIVDTPSGPMETHARVQNGKVQSVAIRMVPSFVYSTDQVLNLPGVGSILTDTVCVGGFFIMVSVEQIGLDLNPKNCSKLIETGMALIDAANQQLTVRHPTRPEVRTVDVIEFYDPSGHSENKGSNIVVYGESHMDRSPCGTGTAAKMTLLHHKGKLAIEQSFINYSPLGTKFEGRIVAETRVGNLEAVITEIRGSAQITGIHEFVVDPQDPFPEGFLL
jgi:proline racemase